MISPYQQSQQDLKLQASAPNGAHWMGTDALGRDVATRVFYGGRVSLLVGFVATGVAVLIGVTYGLVSGLSGGRVDAAMMRFVDILYAFPFLAFVILLNAILGNNETVQDLTARLQRMLSHIPGVGGALEDIGFNASFVILFVGIGAVEWLTMARVVRGQTLALKNQEFITAARSYGARTPRILFRHLLPNVLGPAIIYASLTVPGVMLLEATLSFLGLGIQPPAASWGVLILDGSAQIENAPWLLLYPGGFFALTLLALNFLGDGLRDALDPKSTH
jgi:oligopeptide transport system permease protein